MGEQSTADTNRQHFIHRPSGFITPYFSMYVLLRHAATYLYFLTLAAFLCPDFFM